MESGVLPDNHRSGLRSAGHRQCTEYRISSLLNSSRRLRIQRFMVRLVHIKIGLHPPPSPSSPSLAESSLLEMKLCLCLMFVSKSRTNCCRHVLYTSQIEGFYRSDHGLDAVSCYNHIQNASLRLLERLLTLIFRVSVPITTLMELVGA